MNTIGWHILLFTTAYLALHVAQNYALGPEFIRYHFKDLLLIPMLMFAMGITSRLFNLNLNLDTKEAVIAFVYCVFAFEIVLPAIDFNQSFDWRDIIAYAIGTVGYVLFYKQFVLSIQVPKAVNEKE